MTLFSVHLSRNLYKVVLFKCLFCSKTSSKFKGCLLKLNSFASLLSCRVEQSSLSMIVCPCVCLLAMLANSQARLDDDTREYYNGFNDGTFIQSVHWYSLKTVASILFNFVFFFQK